MKEKTILLLVGGLLLTIVVIVGAILFVPGKKHGYMRETGLTEMRAWWGGGGEGRMLVS